MQVVGEAADWPTVLALAPGTRPDMVVVDWGLVADESGAALPKLREACPAAVVIVLISHLDPRHQAASIRRGRCVYQQKRNVYPGS